MEPINNQNENQNNDKVKIQYDKNIKKIIAIVGGQKNLAVSKKVKGDVLNTVVTELLADDRKAAAEEIKAELKALLQKKVTCDKEIKAKKDELAKLEITKNKEFNEAASKLFGKIEGLDQIEKDFYATLGQGAEAAADVTEKKVKGEDEER